VLAHRALFLQRRFRALLAGEGPAMTQHESTRRTLVAEAPLARSADLWAFLADHHAALLVLAGPRRGSELPLHRPRVVIGRSMGADLVFGDETVSREHAAIAFRDGNFVVEDLRSSNGTLLNGERVEERALQHGDRLRLGNLELQVIVEVRQHVDPDHRGPNAE
jgi:hypothetical protein